MRVVAARTILRQGSQFSLYKFRIVTQCCRSYSGQNKVCFGTGTHLKFYYNIIKPSLKQRRKEAMQKNQKRQTIFYFKTEIRIHCNKSGSGSEPHNTIRVADPRCLSRILIFPIPDGEKRFEFENKGTVAGELPEGTEGGECRRPWASPCSPLPGWDGCTSGFARTPAAGWLLISYSGDLLWQKYIMTPTFIFILYTSGDFGTGRVAELHHFNTDPDPYFLFNADPDPISQFSTLMRIRILHLINVMQSMTTCLQALRGSNSTFHASIVSVHDPPRLHFEASWPPEV